MPDAVCMVRCRRLVQTRRREMFCSLMNLDSMREYWKEKKKENFNVQTTFCGGITVRACTLVILGKGEYATEEELLIVKKTDDSFRSFRQWLCSRLKMEANALSSECLILLQHNQWTQHPKQTIVHSKQSGRFAKSQAIMISLTSYQQNQVWSILFMQIKNTY